MGWGKERIRMRILFKRQERKYSIRGRSRRDRDVLEDEMQSCEDQGDLKRGADRKHKAIANDPGDAGRT